MNKKGAELSINVIIIAVLGLIILAILIFMVSGQLGNFRSGVDACVGTCTSDANECRDDGLVAIPSSCQIGQNDEQFYCCQSLGDGDNS